MRQNLEALRARLKDLYGDDLVRDHQGLEGIFAQAQRFAALDSSSLLKLAKNLFRLTAERFDETKINDLLKSRGMARLGSLKGLERLAADHIGTDTAFHLFTPLHGLAELRQADTHLPSAGLREAYERCGIDLSVPQVIQGQQLIATVASAIDRITASFRPAPGQESQ